MRISSITLKNFRCFGPEPQEITLENLTALVGNNGAGKSAVLIALTRLFGVTAAERMLVRTDFHLAPGESWDDVEDIDLLIEARLDFPELADEDSASDASAACFQAMTIAGPAGMPYAIIRLSAKWTPSNLPEGEVGSNLVWVTGDVGTDDEETTAVLQHDRARIHVHYVPATRDPVRQIRQVSGSMLHSLLRAVEWTPEVKKEIEDAAEEIRDAIGETKGVKTIVAKVQECWRDLHSDENLAQVSIHPVAKRIEDLISQVEASFGPNAGGKEDSIDKLSDGQKSLFYVALMATVFDVRRTVAESDDGDNDEEGHGFSNDRLMSPVLTLLAVEEPENHISPFYLGRIIRVLKRISDDEAGQVVLTSHSASILSRVEPDEIRHLRLDKEGRNAIATALELPDKADEKGKFVREAVRAHPEVYFARFVVLGEGATEEIVIPRAASALGVDIDPNFVAMVPLGGRHVNHFWKLLDQIGVPYVTLLDLDLERESGGWARIKYATLQLLELGLPEDKVLIKGISKEYVEKGLHKRETTHEKLSVWINRLEDFGVYFSAPLDLDFLMLKTFPGAYKKLGEEEEGPRIPDEDEEAEKYAEALAAATEAVLSKEHLADTTYADVSPELFFWYRYLFLGRGKPATHTLALLELTNEELVNDLPEPLPAIVNRIKEAVEAQPDDGDDHELPET